MGPQPPPYEKLQKSSMRYCAFNVFQIAVADVHADLIERTTHTEKEALFFGFDCQSVTKTAPTLYGRIYFSHFPSA
ncbi:hypothetical protein F2P81_022022 [Scophthalmus maximus]|uniref:Uncharacterized protein n=1 Tax=Scophthalmus maximus TaxID=52904 RepID=A0A6A4S1T6_SCOMX|nr:hypothetical protein F2P81_022022 [Scophthalmus maximus]